LLTTTLAGFKGWQLLFIAEAIPGCVFGGVIWFWLKDWPGQAQWLSVAERRHLEESYHRELAQKRAVQEYSVWQALTDREVVKLCVIYFLWITGFWGFNYWMPTVLQEASGWSSIKVGWMIVIPMALALVAMLFAGYSSSRTGEKLWHGAVPMFLGALGMAAGACVTGPGWSFACVCLSGIGVYSAFGVWWSYPTTFLSGAAAAAAIGLINSFGNLGGFLGPFLTGEIKELTGSVRIAYIYLACSLAAAGILMLNLKRSKDERLSSVV
jgi:MFS transporter, ACS family, tartrate transporter